MPESFANVENTNRQKFIYIVEEFAISWILCIKNGFMDPSLYNYGYRADVFMARKL